MVHIRKKMKRTTHETKKKSDHPLGLPPPHPISRETHIYPNPTWSSPYCNSGSHLILNSTPTRACGGAFNLADSAGGRAVSTGSGNSVAPPIAASPPPAVVGDVVGPSPPPVSSGLHVTLSFPSGAGRSASPLAAKQQV